MTDDAKVVLARIDERLKGHVESTQTWQADMSTRTEHIEKCVQRDNVRIDRIEQREKGRARLLWIALTAAIGSLVSWMSTHWK